VSKIARVSLDIAHAQSSVMNERLWVWWLSWAVRKEGCSRGLVKLGRAFSAVEEACRDRGLPDCCFPRHSLQADPQWVRACCQTVACPA
jgi:hypothetical protein